MLAAGSAFASFIAHLSLARTLLEESLAVGLSVRVGALNVFNLDGNDTLFTRGGASAEAGAVWKPRDQDFRLALSAGLPVLTGALSYNCDPSNCYGYILPDDAIVPWESTFGGAWRFGPTYWNHKVDGAYRDERSLTVALEVSVVGAYRWCRGALFAFHLGGQERRVSVSFAADATARYHNLDLSAGFWN